MLPSWGDRGWRSEPLLGGHVRTSMYTNTHTHTHSEGSVRRAGGDANRDPCPHSRPDAPMHTGASTRRRRLCDETKTGFVEGRRGWTTGKAPLGFTLKLQMKNQEKGSCDSREECVGRAVQVTCGRGGQGPRAEPCRQSLGSARDKKREHEPCQGGRVL